MTKYIGNVPLVGKEKTVAFEAFCEKCNKIKFFYWTKPQGKTLTKTVLHRLFAPLHGLDFTTAILCSWRTILLFCKIKKSVSVAECECCQKIKVKCPHCSSINNFKNWQEVYICPNCGKKAYMIMNTKLQAPWFFVKWD